MMDVDNEVPVLHRLFPPRKIEEYLILEGTLGSGAFGQVFRGRVTKEAVDNVPRLELGRRYAVKLVTWKAGKPVVEEIQRSFLSVSRDRHLDFLRMLQGHTSDNHIVNFFGAFVVFPARSMYQVMELLEGPDLFDYLTVQARTLPEARAVAIIRQTVLALDYLHRSIGALHRDVKPENFGFAQPVTEDGPVTLKMFDLGLGWVLPEPVTESTCKNLLELSPAGTRLYMAPEAFRGFCGAPSDVWGAGIVAHMVLCLDMPFGLIGARRPQDAVRTGALTFNNSAWSAFSREAQDLVASMLAKESDARISTSAILAHPWLSSAAGPADCLDQPRFERQVSLPPRATASDGSIWQTVAMMTEQ